MRHSGGDVGHAVLAVPVLRDDVPWLCSRSPSGRPTTSTATPSSWSRCSPVRWRRETADADATTVLSSRLIGDRKVLEAELRHQASHDPLTGLANRSLTSERLEEALGAQGTGPVGLLFCDLDGFKAVNDRFGHDAGDELLRCTAERLRGCIRPGDLLARFGGDEFVVVLGTVQTIADVERVGRRIVASLAEPYRLSAGSVGISASVGGALESAGGSTTATTLIRDADAAMYSAKSQGKNRVEVLDRRPRSR